MNNALICGHENGHADWDFWLCEDCRWLSPSGAQRGPFSRGFFPSLDAVKEFDKYGSFPGMYDLLNERDKLITERKNNVLEQ